VKLQEKLRELLSTVPRWAFLISVPVVALIMATVVALGFDVGGGDTKAPTVRERSTLSLANLDAPDLPPTLTPVPTEVGEVVDPKNRKDCDAIRGTDYKSPAEREWYLANCARTEDTVQTNTSGGGSGNTYVAASEFFVGDRIIIPSIGVDATVTGATVGSGGQMPDPVGYFNAVWYDFKNFPGIGGGRDGNYVLAAHVDCARCHNGSSGTALFYSVSALKPGATAQVVFHDGVVQNYVVRSVAAYSPGANWGAILATSQADMTLITCGGTWDAAAHEYSTRWAAYLDKV
jgi:Sortase domain